MNEDEKLAEEISKQAEGKQNNSEIPNTESNIDEVRKRFTELKELNDKYEAEKLRAEQIKAEQLVHGKSFAGKQELTPEQLAQEEAKDILSKFR